MKLLRQSRHAGQRGRGLAGWGHLVRSLALLVAAIILIIVGANTLARSRSLLSGGEQYNTSSISDGEVTDIAMIYVDEGASVICNVLLEVIQEIDDGEKSAAVLSEIANKMNGYLENYHADIANCAEVLGSDIATIENGKYLVSVLDHGGFQIGFSYDTEINYIKSAYVKVKKHL
ncbi:hypothetical protein [Pelagibacterium halotolerans]|uniref:hypothetical protein n=1 Tax=Pelagibacterium halotolerans TaxID=531813 RepID=UPI00384CA372